ncbi:IclR family transcriptional regulator [Latilactobacillus sakei]|uniref:IclR family transcriptional regulator n=1 Tax=Latilactobacillus sakei TaxID=1599 RepID=UPI00232BB217|nr:IclR family transcriptional regulator [Latilactobacillus sakei]MDB1552670.1 IclR family transcriptional regulator [Latilactobacillus sakei]
MTETKSYGTVLIKAKQILDYLMDQPAGQTLKEISDGLQSTKSTTLKVLATMCELNLLWRSENDKRYFLGSELIGYGQKALSEFDIKNIAVPYLQELRDETGETVHLGIHAGDFVVFLEKLESPHSVNLKSKVGGKLNLFSSAMGKAFLATMPDEQVTAYLERVALTALTTHTITDPSELQKQINQVRERHYSIDDRENEEEVFCVGAVLEKHNRVFGAFSVSTPDYRLDSKRKKAITAAVLKTKEMIERHL